MHYRTTALNSTTASKIRQKYANSCKMQIYFVDNGHLYFCLIEFSFFSFTCCKFDVFCHICGEYCCVETANIMLRIVSTKISLSGVHSCHINPVLEKKLNVLYKFFFAEKTVGTRNFVTESGCLDI